MADSLQAKIQHYQAQQFTGLVKVSAHLQTQRHPNQNKSTQNDPFQINQQQRHSPDEWVIFLLLGHIVWTTTSVHPLRRWKRALRIHSLELYTQINHHPGGIPYQHWHYTALARLVKLGKYPRSQFSNVVESSIAETLFNILQAATQIQRQAGLPAQQILAYEESEYDLADLPVLMIKEGCAWREAQQEWKTWERAKLTDISPDWAPVITQLEPLRQKTSPETFQTLTTFINGKSTLRDLAIQFRQPIVSLTKSILPYISAQLLGFTDIPDLIENANHGFPQALFSATRFTAIKSSASASPTSLATSLATSAPITFEARPPETRPPETAPKGITPTIPQQAVPIIYIDDNPRDSQRMSEIVEGLGYQYTNIPDPIQALPLLLEIQPKLIFLDLVMPIANGYEVCAQIRRISAFKNTPVVIVTGNDGIADRVRARLVGASGFLGKPIQQLKVAKVLKKHLSSATPRPSRKTIGQHTKNVLYSRRSS